MFFNLLRITKQFMIKHLHFILLIAILSLFSTVIFSQNGRVKATNAKTIQGVFENNSSNQKTLPANISEKEDMVQTKNEVKTSVTQLRSSIDSALVTGKKNKQQDDASFKSAQSAQKIPNTDNVNYIKEDLPENEKLLSAEKKSVKVVPSVNYKPRIIKSDIQPVPVVDNSKIEINSNKRIYLQQEADDLQREINQNTGNVNYDLAKKQQQLESIKKMLQN